MSSNLSRDAVKMGFPVPGGFRPPTDRLDGKRLLDLFLGSLLLLIAAPVMALVALAVTLETRGPVLVCQKRTGRNGKTFPLFQFRSMRILEKNVEIRQAVAGDVRITRVGRIIRKLSLDELPQLFNVIAGQISLVAALFPRNAH